MRQGHDVAGPLLAHLGQEFPDRGGRVQELVVPGVPSLDHRGSLGGEQADDADGDAVHPEDLEGLEGAVALGVHHVGHQDGVVGLGGHVEQDLGAPVKLVVPDGARGGLHRVAADPHGLAVEGVGERGSLGDVPSLQVHHRTGMLGTQLTKQGGDAGQTAATLVVGLDVAMKVIGVDDDDLLGRLRSGSFRLDRRGHGTGQQHGQAQSQGAKDRGLHLERNSPLRPAVPDEWAPGAHRERPD